VREEEVILMKGFISRAKENKLVRSTTTGKEGGTETRLSISYTVFLKLSRSEEARERKKG
jgi:hypothetical protein